MKESLRLLAVFPHPDDESLGLGGTLARYSAEGVETYLVCATRGERGWNGPEEDDPGFEALGRIREAELRCASDQLGLKEVNLLDLIDGEVDQAEPAQVIADICAHIRRIRPQVVITFSLDGNYGHPDHIALAQLTAGALVCAADAGYRDPEDQAPFRVSKFYHMVDSTSMVDAFRAAFGGISMEVDGAERGQFGWEEWAVTTRIDAQAYFERVWQAILCHRSQLPGYGPLVELPNETRLRFWCEGTFVRVFSLVNGGRAVERDLFAIVLRQRDEIVQISPGGGGVQAVSFVGSAAESIPRDCQRDHHARIAQEVRAARIAIADAPIATTKSRD